jgi:hypothetical protein
MCAKCAINLLFLYIITQRKVTLSHYYNSLGFYSALWSTLVITCARTATLEEHCVLFTVSIFGLRMIHRVNTINPLVFVTETQCVSDEVETGFLNLIYINFRFFFRSDIFHCTSYYRIPITAEELILKLHVVATIFKSCIQYRQQESIDTAAALITTYLHLATQTNMLSPPGARYIFSLISNHVSSKSIRLLFCGTLYIGLCIRTSLLLLWYSWMYTCDKKIIDLFCIHNKRLYLCACVT